MGDKRRIMVLTLSFGTGHVSAAEAVAASLGRRAPDAEVVLIDALADCRLLFRMFYVWTYWAMIRYAPSLWDRLFAARIANRHEGTAPGWVLRWGFGKTLRRIAEFRPDMIAACEVAASELAVIARRDLLTNAKIVNVITDLEAEPIWVSPEIDVYAVPDDHVAGELVKWDADAGKIEVCGIPVGKEFVKAHDQNEMLSEFGLDERPVVLLMGGGMGPTRMDAVARKLIDSGTEMQIVAMPGRDQRARRRLKAINDSRVVTLHILSWTDKVAPLMQTADLLVTKPGGVTLAEAAVSGLPFVLFDPIPGPEETNARRFADNDAAMMAAGGEETANAVIRLLGDRDELAEMSQNVRKFARADAADTIAVVALKTLEKQANGPVMILTISNGAGGNRTAETIAEDIRRYQPGLGVTVVDVADHMSPLTRLTHVTIYLWLVKYTPWLWERIDRHQKRQETTSPEWYYRRGCRKIFRFADAVRPSALVATEVGCCEIAALVKHDLALDIPLMAVHTDLDSDRAWIRPEVDLYCLVTEECAAEFVNNGAPRERIAVWGPPLGEGYSAGNDRSTVKKDVCESLGLDPAKPLILVAGGSEGLGDIEGSVSKLLAMTAATPQVIVLTGRNKRLKTRCERLAMDNSGNRLRVMGWVEPDQMPGFMRAADMAVSKLGNFFNEALAVGLPIVALEPPPGGEREHYRLLAEWDIGRAVKTQDEMAETVLKLLENKGEIEVMRERMAAYRSHGAGRKIADWLGDRLTVERRGPEISHQEAKNRQGARQKKFAVAL